MSARHQARPMPDWMFRGMSFIFLIRDMLSNPRKRLDSVQLRPGMTLLDYGCGPGSHTIPAAEIVGPEGRVYAVDVHPLAIRTIQAKAARKGLTNVEAIQVNDFNTDIPDASVDRVLLLDMIHMVSDRAALLGEVHRLLNLDGLVLIQVDHMPVAQVKGMVERTGLFTVIEAQGADLLIRPRRD